MRFLAFVVLVGFVAALGGQASAERRARADRDAGFTFELNGTALKVSIRPGQGADRARDEVYGKRVTAVCSSSYAFSPGSRVIQELRWLAGQDELTFTFGRDISRSAKGCLIEDAGGSDIAVVSFGPEPGTIFVQTQNISGATPRGVRAFFVVRNSQGRTVARGRGREFYGVLEPGRYRLSRYERRCRRGCRKLGPPVLRCSRRLRLPQGAVRAGEVLVDRKHRRCRFDFTRGL